MPKLLNTLDEFQKVIKQLKADTAESIKGLRSDNPDINRVSKNAFTISSSRLSSDLILDAFYYDWTAQYDYILELLNKQSLDTFVQTITTICNTGVLYKESRRFHPEVRAKLSVLIQEGNDE